MKRLFTFAAAVLCAAAVFAQIEPLHEGGAVVSANGYVGDRRGGIEITNNSGNRNFPVSVWGYKAETWSYVGSCSVDSPRGSEDLEYAIKPTLDFEYYEVTVPGAESVVAVSQIQKNDLVIYVDAFTTNMSWSKDEAELAARETIVSNLPLPGDIPVAKIVPAEVNGKEAERLLAIVNNSNERAFSATVYGMEFDSREWELVGIAHVLSKDERDTVDGPKSDLERYKDFDFFAISVDGAHDFELRCEIERKDLIIHIDRVDM